MKLLIAGSRSLDGQNDYEQIREFVEENLRNIDVIIHGGAHGIDLLGAAVAEEKNIRTERFTPNWSRDGKKAGMIRNTEMVAACDFALVLWDGESRGTLDTIKKLYEKKTPTKLFIKKYEPVSLELALEMVSVK